MLRVLLAGGGTAGHVNPALAIAEIIKKHYPDAEISFAGNPEKLEARLVPAAGYKFYPIKIEGFQRKPNWVNLKRNIHAAGCLVKSGSTAKKIIKEARPDLVIGTGGYVSGPIVRKAAKMGIKTAIHEQNAFPGVTNKILAKSADVVMLTVKEAEKYMPENAKTVVTGLPVRGAFNTMSKSEAKKQLGFDENETITETVRHPGESAALCDDPVDGGSPAERRQRISGHALLRGGYDAAAARRLCSLPDRPWTAAHSG